MKDDIKTKIKKGFSYVFIDGLTGMAWGLFSTLIIGLIIEQIGKLIGGNIGNLIVVNPFCYDFCSNCRTNRCFCK